MLLSRAHRFLFIHVCKTGGTSVRRALAPYADRPGRPPRPWARWRPGLPPAADPCPLLPAHATAAEARAALPAALFDGCFKFAFVRNPWDWQVSWYHFLRRDTGHPQHALASRMAGFADFLRWRARHDPLLQKSFLTDAAGGPLVDFVGRFESLAEDFRFVCGAVGVRAGLPHLNRSPHGDYRSYYTPETRRLVEEVWREDIECFGYEFDPPAKQGFIPSQPAPRRT